MTHQRAPGFGRPPQTPNDVDHLNYVSSGFWAKTNNHLLNNPADYPINVNSLIESANNHITRLDSSQATLKDEFLWKRSSANSVSIPSNSRSLGINFSSSNTLNHTSNQSSINQLMHHSRVKPFQTRHHNTSATNQDLLLAQFLGLCLNNQQSTATSNDNLNSFSSSSSSLGSFNKLFDSPGNPYNSSNNISLRKLKARTEDNISSNIPLDQYHPSLSTSNSHNGNSGGGSGKRKNRRGSCMECVFCKNNGQPQSFYQNHVLKDLLGRVTCPILYAYDCPICHNGGGPRAHTVRYCPQNKPSNRLRNAILKSQSFTSSTNNQSII